MKTYVLLWASMFASSCLTACSGGDMSGSSTSGAGGSGSGDSTSTQSSTTGSTTGSTTSTTSSTTSSTTGGGGSGAIQAPKETWTWIPFDDAFCADGSTTGIGVNLTDKSSRVLIFLQGGGGCWDEATCYTVKTAAHIEGGYKEADFTAEVAKFLNLGFFDRTDATNPFKDYSLVYVPYCTGDIHAGDNVADYGGKKTMHVGFKNMKAYLSRLVPTFPSAERVYLSGVSAGGYGAGVNWWQTQQAFGKVRVDMIDDSGTMLAPMYTNATYAQLQRQNWNLDATLPAGCTECKTDTAGLLSYYGTVFADHRAAVLSYTRDTVISQFNTISLDTFTKGLDEMAKARIDPFPNFHYFFFVGENHVLWGDPTLTTNGVTLKQWLTQMVTDDKAWTSQHP